MPNIPPKSFQTGQRGLPVARLLAFFCVLVLILIFIRAVGFVWIFGIHGRRIHTSINLRAGTAGDQQQ